MSVYRVDGRLAFRGHKPGDVFEAELEPAEELRAIRRGNITILDPARPGLRPGSYRLPHGWLTDAHHQSPGNGALSLEGAS